MPASQVGHHSRTLGQHQQNLHVIWESTAINRATYIFKTSVDTYYQDVQRIFDFIASEQKRKRSKLRKSIGWKNPLKNIGVAQHEGLKAWIAKINSIVKQ